MDVSVAVNLHKLTPFMSMDSYASITGDLALYDKRGKICQWIEDIDAIETNHSRSPTLVTEESIPSSQDQDDLVPKENKNDEREAGLQIRLKAPESVLDPEDLDLEDDFFVEAAQQALEKGKTAFAESEYKGSFAYLKEGLSMSKELSRKPQALYDTWELRRMLGICAFHIDSPAEAEDALLSVLANAPKNAILSENQRLQVSETAHMLAQVDVKLGKLEQAYRYCEYALRGRRRVLGKNHEQSYESLALMAKVLELQKNEIRAEFFVGMIPEAEREKYIQKFSDLKVPENMPSRQAEQQHRRMPSTPPQSPPLRNISELVKAPPIPQRSPSRSGADFKAHKQEDFRPSSALSGRVSAMSGPNSTPPSEAGETATQISLSPPNSPELNRLPPALRAGTAAYPGNSPPSNYHLARGPYPLTPPDRPDHKRTLSNRSTSTLPVIPEPAVAEDVPLNAMGTLPPGDARYASQDGTDPQPQRSTQLYPRPLRMQRQIFISELPGDSEFGTPSSPRSEASVPVETAKGHHHRDSAFTVSSLRRSPNIALPEQEEGFGQLSPQQAQRHQPVAYPSGSILPDHDPQARDHAYSPPAPQHTYSAFPQPHPMDHRSFYSSTCSSVENLRSTHDLNFVPFTHGRTETTVEAGPSRDDTAIGKSKRKHSLLRVFRSQTAPAATPLPPTSDPRNASLTYNGVRLSRKDIDLLKSGDHLSDATVDFWQEYLEHEMLQHNPRYVLLRPMRSHLLVSATTPTELKAALPIDQDSSTTVQHILIPLQSPTSLHWSLLVVSPADNLACHYDPSSNKRNNRNLASQMTTKVSGYIGKSMNFVDVPDTPEQVKEQDCGVFVCFFMQHLISKLQSTHVSDKVDATLKCKTIEGKSARKVILKAVEARRKSKETGTLFQE